MAEHNTAVAAEASAADIIAFHVKQGQLDTAGNDSSDIPRRKWQTMPEIPKPEELLASAPPSLPDDVPEGEEPIDKPLYLENQYRFQRYEGTELLRLAIHQFKRQPSMMEDARNAEFFIYTQVHVKGYIFARLGAACRISFSTERSPTKINWIQSSRLTTGTLVVLSPKSDNFRTKCFVAVVAARYLIGGLLPNYQAGEDQNTPPRIEIFWEDPNDAIINPSEELIMLEASGGYFETVRHAMVGLQHAALYDSKFDKYIIEGCKDNKSAKYLDHFPAVVPDGASHFDHSQMDAFKRMTSQELALVQGPPGTGKTFTSVIGIESYIRTLQAGRRDGSIPPVIVAAQTNHALDQLLGHCMSFGANIVRLGGRSQVDAINERSMYEVRQASTVKPFSQGEAARKALLKRAQSLFDACFPGGLISAEHFFSQKLITQEQLDSLEQDDWDCVDTVDASDSGSDHNNLSGSMAKWLDGCIEQDRTYIYCPPTQQTTETTSDDGQEISQDDDEKNRLKGDFLCTEFYYTGTVAGSMAHSDAQYHQGSQYLKKHSDLYRIKPPQRGLVYRYLRHCLINKMSTAFPELLIEYQKTCDEIKMGRWYTNIKVIQHEKIEVIGCTTTGLTKYRGLLAALKPRVLMIEEAAETREANITSALYPSLDQVVLVGDHQQLVPQVDVPLLGQRPYNLHVSLFERLVRIRFPFSMLCVQRRMRPAIREVVHAFYPRLEDHDSVKDPENRPPVPGMGGKNLWWLSHHDRDEVDGHMSFYNTYEADMIVGFIKYLIQNGALPSQITVLTYYNGQLKLVRDKLKGDPMLSSLNPTKEWSVRTVDGFQGEENEFILLSLVRSTAQGERPKVGFVKNENRAVVATSRARRGMYVFGNSHNILGDPESSATWLKVYNVFNKNDNISYSLPVVCKKHSTTTFITRPEDWEMVPAGGCHRPCEETCPQGHACKEKCHPVDQSRIKCKYPCEKMLPCGHKCRALCGQDCQCPKGCNRPNITKLANVVLPVRQPKTAKLTSTAAATTSKGGKVAKGPAAKGPPTRSSSNNNRGGPQSNKGPQRGNYGKNRGGKSQSQTLQSRKKTPPPKMNMMSVHERPSLAERAMTSDDLINNGYNALLTQHNPMSTADSTADGEDEDDDDEALGVGRLLSSKANTEDVLSSVDSSTEKSSLSEKWSPEKMQQRERVINRKIPERLAPSSMTIRETFVQTRSNGMLGRVAGKRVHTQYTAPTSSKCPSEASSAISKNSSQVSRKQEALDAAAGFAPGQTEPEAINKTVEVEQRIDDSEMDLMTFD